MITWTEQDESTWTSDLHYVRVGCDGAVEVEDTVVIPGTGFNSQSSLQWNGSSMGLMWGDDDCPTGTCNRFSFMDHQGGILSSWSEDEHLPPGHATLVWNGSVYLAGLINFGGEVPGINTVVIDEDGSMAGPPTTLANDVLTAGPAVGVAWSGSEFAVVWHQIPGLVRTELQFARIGPAGGIVEPPVQLTNMDWSYGPDIVWTGSEYGIAWISRRHYDNRTTSFVRLDPAGNPLGSIAYDTGIDSWQPTLVWTGSLYRAFWVDGMGGGKRLVFDDIDADGAWSGNIRVLADSREAITFPVAVSFANGTALAWSESAPDGGTCFEAEMDPDADYPRCDMNLYLGLIPQD